jgi:hypothetical protein
MVCIVSLIIALIFFWWFTHRPYTKENFATPMPYIVMVGLTTGGRIYYADMDVPIQPKWIETSLTGISDMAGSYGQLFTVNTGGSVPKYGAYDSSTQTSMNGANPLTQVTVDDINKVAGVNGTTLMYASSFTSNLSNPYSSTAKWVSMSAGIGYLVGSDGKLYYSVSPATGPWKLIDIGTNWKQVCIDGGVVCAIKNDGTLWYIDKNIGFLSTGESITSGANSGSAAANITQSTLPAGVTFSYISLKAGRLVGVGNNGTVYYSDSYSNPTWKTISTQPYNVTTGVASGSAVTFSKVVLMYPRMDARRKRFLGSSKACNSNEQQIGNFCYQPCPSGKDPKGASCPYLAKYVNAIPRCPARTEFINGGCFEACPSGYTADGDVCKGATTPKRTSAFSTTATRRRYTCRTDGTVTGRYVRVRPTPLINNNKLCISKIIVKDSTGRDLSTKSTTPTVMTSATDGTCIDAPVGGTTCPSVASIPSSYLSGNTYAADSDGGKVSRTNNLYWDVDLGSIQNIKSIEFIGCTYQKDSSSTASTAAVGNTNVIQDQIKGMRIEVLYNDNSPTTPPIASRTLGSAKTQTITFDYSRRFPDNDDTGDRCYDSCPKINGVDSMDQQNNSCLVATGGITNRAVSVPLPLGDPICGPPTRADGTIDTMAAVNRTTGAAMTIGNWVVDPGNNAYQLSCDVLPGSRLKNLSYRFFGTTLGQTNISSKYGRFISFSDIFSIVNCAFTSTSANSVACGLSMVDTSWLLSGSAYTNPDTNYACVLEDSVICPPNYLFKPELNTCEVDSRVMTTRPWTDTWKCRSTTCFMGVCGLPADCGNHSYNDSIPLYVDNLMKDNTNYKAGTKSTLNYANPTVVEGVSIAKPQRVISNCKCLNPDGTQNKSAFIYNGKCIKCSSPRDVFYAKGATNNITWTNGQAGTITRTSTNSLGVTSSIEETQFATLDDAKNACETQPACTGITRYIDTNGSTYYAMGTSTPQNTGTLNNNMCWSKITGSKSLVRHGNYEGSEFSALPIPRAFADNYISSNPSDRPTNLASSSAVEDLYSKTYTRRVVTETTATTSGTITTQPATGTQSTISYLVSAVGQAAAGLMYQMSVERPETYYSLQGLERRIKANISSSTDNYGVCVGPCDPEHPIHDPIQLLYDPYNPTATSALYVLYGAVCYDSSETVINKPSIPAISTAAVGNLCQNGFYDNGTNCLEQCSYDSIDTGTSCTTPSIPRSSVSPTYSCSDSNKKPVGSVCVYDCEGTDVLVGEYCEPSANPVSISTAPTTINCTRTTYSYSSKYQTTASSVGKWLCDSQDDLNALLAGYLPDSGTTYYVNENDVVCVADDPTTGMYYCQSVDEAVNQTQDTARDDNTTVCNNLVSAYYDLSNNLNIISSAKANAQNASLQVANIQITLQGVYNSICSTRSTDNQSMCTTLQSQLAALAQNINGGSTANSNVLNPIQMAMSSRDNLVAQMTKFQCEY